jgi:hypothetical protein
METWETLLDDRMRHLVDQAAEAVAASTDLPDLLRKVVARAGHRRENPATTDSETR